MLSQRRRRTLVKRAKRVYANQQKEPAHHRCPALIIIIYIFYICPMPGWLAAGGVFLLNTYKYRISSIPAVFIINSTTNQGLLELRAARHKARPFQTRLQIITKPNNIPAPGEYIITG